jgi:hypothetical protein
VTQVLVAGVLIVVAVIVATAIQAARRPAPPTQPALGQVPAQLDRRDFGSPSAPWLVVVFTSATCHTCADVVAKASVPACGEVAVDEAEYRTRTDVHRRYHIDAVPLLVVADGAGVVRASFVGPVTATDLWAAVAEVRRPGSSPEPHLGQPTES